MNNLSQLGFVSTLLVSKQMQHRLDADVRHVDGN